MSKSKQKQSLSQAEIDYAELRTHTIKQLESSLDRFLRAGKHAEFKVLAEVEDKKYTGYEQKLQQDICQHFGGFVVQTKTEQEKLSCWLEL